MTKLHFILTVLIAAALAACAPIPVRKHESTPAAQAAQEARETTFASRTRWTLAAQIGVSNGSDSGSGELDWRQTDDVYAFTVRAPITGKSWKLSGDAQHAKLEGVDAQPDEDNDGGRLLRERVGWDVPLANLRAWVRGLRAPGTSAQISYDDHDLPALIVQDGWKVEYRDWFIERNPAMPRRVFATRGNMRVKLAIETWSFEPAQ